MHVQWNLSNLDSLNYVYIPNTLNPKMKTLDTFPYPSGVQIREVPLVAYCRHFYHDRIMKFLVFLFYFRWACGVIMYTL